MYFQKLNLVWWYLDLELDVLLHGDRGNVLGVLVDKLNIDWDDGVLLGEDDEVDGFFYKIILEYQ